MAASVCTAATVGEAGRGERIRTFDLLNPIQVRYQAALRPDRAVEYTRQRQAIGIGHAVRSAP